MISIVIPVYNSIDTLEDAFFSAVGSGIGEQEIILVDDGSTDASWDCILELQGKVDNVVALRHPQNRGGGAARNTGINAARYPLIFVLDSDDLLAPTGALGRAAAMMEDVQLDGVATGESSFFETDPAVVLQQVHYAPGLAGFSDLLSGHPSPVAGNLLFRKSAYDRARGYPEYHTFDTQAFGFRLLANRARVQVMDEILYYQRRPARPSYYARENAQGNGGRNWYYVFSECLYKFSAPVRREILEFDYRDPASIARGCNLFQVIAGRSSYDLSDEGLRLDDSAAYLAYSNSSDPTLQFWCATMDLRRGDIERCTQRIDEIGEPYGKRAIYPLLAAWSKAGLSKSDLEELRYFFGSDKGRLWHLKHTLQRVRNRVGRMLR